MPEEGDTPLFLTKLPGYRFDKKKGSVPYFNYASTALVRALSDDDVVFGVTTL